MISASAPGKIILFGEHAVVYGRPALATPVTQVHATASVIPLAGDELRVEAADIGLHADLSSLPDDDPLAVVIRSVFSTLKVPVSPCKIKVTSTIPIASGLGSGAAVSVAIIRALTAFLGSSQPDEQVSALAYDVEKIHHGTPSGIDNSVITYGRPIIFQKTIALMAEGGQNRIELVQVGKPFTLVIADTGIAALTKESVTEVRKLWEAEKSRWEKVFDEIGSIVKQARDMIATGKWQGLGSLMDANHALLQGMTVSSKELDQLVGAARNAGALGAKLSGGGRGGNMIALVNQGDAHRLSQVLLSKGAKRTIITTVQ